MFGKSNCHKIVILLTMLLTYSKKEKKTRAYMYVLHREVLWHESDKQNIILKDTQIKM